jgi:hypothetical protein
MKMRRIARAAVASAWLSVSVGCGGAANAPPRAASPAAPSATPKETPPTPTPAAPSDPFAVDGLVREEWLPLLKGPEPAFADVSFPDAPKNVPVAPAAVCDAFVKRPAKKMATCDKPAGLAALDAAMALSDVAARDKGLASLETCAAFPPGLVRVLRIELAPPECGDVLAEPLLKKKVEGIPGAVHHALVGQALAARLMRTVQSPPKLEGPTTKDRVSEFVKGPMMTWFQSQAKAVEELSKMGAQLSYYGKGVVALAAGTADLRLVDAVREVPIPDEFRVDPELANEYYSRLDDALEPRKARGRDGALVGLKEMAFAGIVDDPRTKATRALLAKLYGGRKIDALDALALPKPLPVGNGTLEERLAASLPTFVAGQILDPAVATDPKVLRAFAQRGVPVPMRVALKEKEAGLGEEARAAYARARLAMGIAYWRAEDFDAVAALLSKIPKDKLAADDRLVFATALALRGGPDDLAALMQKAGTLGPSFGKPRALDVIAADAGPTQGLAAYDAAVVTQVAMSRGAEPAEWSALAKRYDAAAPLLEDQKTRLEAQQRARAAEATAKAIAPKSADDKKPEPARGSAPAQTSAKAAPAPAASGKK